MNAKKKKAGHGDKKSKKPTTTKIVPKQIQVQMSLYLGLNRISEFSYSKPQIFNQNVYFGDEEISF